MIYGMERQVDLQGLAEKEYAEYLDHSVSD